MWRVQRCWVAMFVEGRSEELGEGECILGWVHELGGPLEVEVGVGKEI